jgi:hypothetical protein
VRLEVFTAVRKMMFWVLVSCRLVCRCQCFRETALKMETVYFTETLASTDESIRCQNPEEQPVIKPSPSEPQRPFWTKFFLMNCYNVIWDFRLSRLWRYWFWSSRLSLQSILIIVVHTHCARCLLKKTRLMPRFCTCEYDRYISWKV